MFVNDDIYHFLSDMTENEKRKEGDYLMTSMFCNTCKSTLLTHFLETAVFQKSLSFTTHLQI